jgi:hypothetical protein
MRINKVIKELKKIRNEYGNVEVMVFDASAWDNGQFDEVGPPLEGVDFEKDNNRVVLY